MVLFFIEKPLNINNLYIGLTEIGEAYGKKALMFNGGIICILKLIKSTLSKRFVFTPKIKILFF